MQCLRKKIPKVHGRPNEEHLIDLKGKKLVLVFGNPAKQMGWMCECGERLTDDIACTVCNKIYKKTTEGIEANDHQ